MKFASFYIPAIPNPEYILQVLTDLLKKAPILFSNIEGSIQVSLGWSGSEYSEEAKDLKFSGRVYIYSELELERNQALHLQDIASRFSLSVQIRGRVMIQARAITEKPRAFISHDFRDKESVGRPLAIELSRLMCPVWYDEFSLRVGDSLRESIENGIKECGRCVIILSPNYLNNSGWTKSEFNSVFTRELIEEKKLILPVWSEVSPRDVFEYCPSLVDRVAAIWNGNAAEIARKLLPVIIESHSTHWSVSRG